MVSGFWVREKFLFHLLTMREVTGKMNEGEDKIETSLSQNEIQPCPISQWEGVFSLKTSTFRLKFPSKRGHNTRWAPQRVSHNHWGRNLHLRVQIGKLPDAAADGHFHLAVGFPPPEGVVEKVRSERGNVRLVWCLCSQVFHMWNMTEQLSLVKHQYKVVR